MIKSASAMLQSSFFDCIDNPMSMLNVLDHVPDAYFFIKDTKSRMIWVSRPKLDRMKMKAIGEIVGTTDFDFFPKHIADNFVSDDQRVFKTGSPLIDRVEIWFARDGQLDWSVTTKYPIFGHNRKVVGLIGFVKNSSTSREAIVADSQLGLAISFIEANHRSSITVTEIARAAHLSPRQLLRQFHTVFGIGIQEFVIKTRIHAASSALLSDNTTISGVATDFCFCDQSAFTRQFRTVTGMTPLDFQRKYGKRR